MDSMLACTYQICQLHKAGGELQTRGFPEVSPMPHRKVLLVSDQKKTVFSAMGTQLRPTSHEAFGFVANQQHACGFNGEYRDPFTGHYLLGHGYRAYNPALRRFTSSDSLSPFGRGGINSYVYCSGDAVNFNDPSGRAGAPSGLKAVIAAGKNLPLFEIASKHGPIFHLTGKESSEVIRSKLTKHANYRTKMVLEQSTPQYRAEALAAMNDRTIPGDRFRMMRRHEESLKVIHYVKDQPADKLYLASFIDIANGAAPNVRAKAGLKLVARTLGVDKSLIDDVVLRRVQRLMQTHANKIQLDGGITKTKRVTNPKKLNDKLRLT